MGKVFDANFSEALRFSQDCWYVSRAAYSREEAAKVMTRSCGIRIKPEWLTPAWVRYQFASESVRWEFGCDHCWMVVPEGTHNAQPTWEYDETIDRDRTYH